MSAVQSSESLVAPPQTTVIDAEKALRTLNHAEMLALAGMYERWALTEERLTPDERTKLIVWSADYDRIAEHVGECWVASEPDASDPISYLAKLELGATR